MVVEWLLSVASNLTGWVVSLFPLWEVPVWVADLDNVVNQVTAGLNGLGAWVNWALMFTCFGASLLTFCTCLGIKSFRTLVAHFPQFGGSG